MKHESVLVQSVAFSILLMSTGLVFAQTPVALDAKEVSEKKEAVIEHHQEMKKEHREKMREHHEMKAKQHAIHRAAVKQHRMAVKAVTPVAAQAVAK